MPPKSTLRYTLLYRWTLIKEYLVANWRFIIGGVVLVGVIAGIAWAIVASFASAARPEVATSDLERVYIGQTSYLHPKAWKSVDVGTTSAFGDQSGTNGKSTAVVSVNVSEVIDSAKDSSDSDLASTRASLLDQTDAETISSTAGRCVSVEKFKKSPDTKQVGETDGIMRVEGVCLNTGGNYRIVLRVALGHDGRSRTIAIIASEESWRRNDAAYEAILKSIEQVK